MDKQIKIIFILCSIVIIIITLIIIKGLFFPVIYPTKSSPQKLTLAIYRNPYINRPIVTLKHYINEQHIADYILTIENGVKVYEPQSYILPKLNEGVVEVNIELGDEINSSFIISDIQANELFNDGFLIYLYSDHRNRFYNESMNLIFHEQYVNFIFGSNRIVYYLSGENRASGYYMLDTGNWGWTDEAYPEWTIVTNSPRLKKLPHDIKYYSKWYSGWKENKWIKVD
ncbi:MAG: hypothetical protein FWC09_07365 [Lachnospiraceae bacterium]|nr:hypothetical protein [Lachnospiraceae bacterium]